MKDNCDSLSHMEHYDLILRTFLRMHKAHIPKKTIVMQIENRYIMWMLDRPGLSFLMCRLKQTRTFGFITLVEGWEVISHSDPGGKIRS